MAAKFSQTVRSIERDHFASSLLLAFGAALVLVAWVAWGVWARVGVIEASTTARLEASEVVHPIQVEVAGRVLRNEVVLGRVVTKGDVLLQLESRNEELQLREATERRAGLESQLVALRSEVATREQARQATLLASETASQETVARGADARQRAAEAEEEERRLSALRAEGHIGEIEMMRATSEAKSQASQASVLALTGRRIAVEARSKDSELRAILTQLAKDAAALEAEMSTLAATQERLRIDIEKRTVKATISGRVGEITPLPVGSVVTAGTRLCSIVPDAPLRIVSEFPWASAIGRVKPGARGTVRLSGFSWVEYGTLRGTVTTVGSEPKDGAVRVELALDPITAFSGPVEHGLAAEVLVEVERVAPLQLLARAVGKRFGRAPPEAPPQGAP
jgi:hemolysin D